MPPKKVSRPAQENISLGPNAREGQYFEMMGLERISDSEQVNSFSALPVSSPLSTTPSSTSPIFRTFSLEGSEAFDFGYYQMEILN
jgi:hypothetical protein